VEAIEPGAQRTGAILSTAREAAGISLIDIARDTRVPVRHLKAIDLDDHSNLPALPYAIGFVKSYARAVGLDPEAVAAQFRAETSKTAHVPTVPSLEPLDERRVPGRGIVLGSIAAIVVIIAGLSAWGSGAFDPAPPIAVAEAPATDPAETLADTPQADTGIAPVAVAAPGAPAATAGAPVAAGATGPVVLTATEDVWIKIYDRATRTSAKIGILKTGETFAVPAELPGLLLWTGKAGALQVSVGGRKLPPLGGPVETVRDVSLAPADLLARAAPPAAVPAVLPVAVPPPVPGV
jgi:cytoskeletal protein RodZ